VQNLSARSTLRTSIDALPLVVAFAFDPAVDPGFIEAEAEGGVAEYLVEVAHGEVVVVDVAEGWAG
jgi:hypothetical protein